MTPAKFRYPSILIIILIVLLPFQNCTQRFDAPSMNSASDFNNSGSGSTNSTPGTNSTPVSSPVTPVTLVQMGSPQDIWNVNISQAAVDSNSGAIITWLNGNGGWGGYVGWGNCNGKSGYACNYIDVEPAFFLMHSNSSTPMAPLQQNSG